MFIGTYHLSLPRASWIGLHLSSCLCTIHFNDSALPSWFSSLVLFPHIPRLCMHLCSLPYMPYAPTILSSCIWSSFSYLASSAGHETPLCPIFSILLLSQFSSFQYSPHSSVIDYIQSLLFLYNQRPNFTPYNGTSKIVSLVSAFTNRRWAGKIMVLGKGLGQ